MSHLEPDPFIILDPPPGGLERLRARLDRRTRRRRMALGTVTLCLAAAAVSLLTLLPPVAPPTDLDTDPVTRLLHDVEHPALTAWGHAPTPTEGITILAGATDATRVETRRRSVVMYELSH